MDSSAHAPPGFQDMLPLIAEKLGGEALIAELCKGFDLLVDKDRHVITFESLKSNSEAVLGLEGMGDEELRCMVSQGDLDGDGALNLMEFCVLMFRLSPRLMDLCWDLMREGIEGGFRGFL